MSKYAELKAALRRRDLTRIENVVDLFDLGRSLGDLDLNDEVMRIAAREAKRQNSLEFYDLYKKTLLVAAPHRLDAYLLYLEFNRPVE